MKFKDFCIGARSFQKMTKQARCWTRPKSVSLACLFDVSVLDVFRFANPVLVI